MRSTYLISIGGSRMDDPMKPTTPREAFDAPSLEGTGGAGMSKKMSAITPVPEAVRTPSFDGWGCSLCWWANEYGESPSAETLADYFFSVNYTNGLPCLGMNIVRYNVGAGNSTRGHTAKIDDNTIENISPNNPVGSFRYMNGFWLNWFSDNPENAGSWDWTSDPRQRAMLQLARERGVNLIEFFSNSPPWWMCYNHSASGADGVYLSGNNLQDWNYQQFAKYIAIVVAYFRDKWGILVDYIEPFNEPASDPPLGWWTYPGRQEGCNFNWLTQGQVLAYLSLETSARKLPAGVTASDENSMGRAIATLAAWSALGRDKNPASLLTKINVHGYDGLDPYRGGLRADLRALVKTLPGPPKKLWMSEYGDGDPTGLTMATSIMLDMSQLQPDAWIYWQPIDAAWGFFSKAAPDDYGYVQRKFYVFAQFSRHVRHGDSILDSDSPWTILAHNPAQKRISIVYLKTFTAQGYVVFDISKIAGKIRLSQLRGYQTTTHPGVNSAPDYLYRELQAGTNQLSFNPETSEVSILSWGQDITSIDVIYQ